MCMELMSVYLQVRLQEVAAAAMFLSMLNATGSVIVTLAACAWDSR